MICDRCGNDMQENTTVCPVCGALTAKARAKLEPSTSYGSYPPNAFGEPSAYERGYTIQSPPPPPPRSDYASSYTQNPYSYAPPRSHYNTPPGQIHITIVNTGKNDGALIAEVLFSLFGIFGVGWIIGGDTAIGIVLLIASFTIYWPIMFIGTIITLGLGLILLGPLAIGAIIINAVLLNNRLQRKATRYYYTQQYTQQQPHGMRMPRRPQE